MGRTAPHRYGVGNLMAHLLGPYTGVLQKYRTGMLRRAVYLGDF